MSDNGPPPARPGRHLVIVSGSGRSGTSTAAGTLKKLGLVVPPPEIQPNGTNPRGFFEPRWVVDFHKQWLARARVRTLDARPEAIELVSSISARPKPRRQLTEWLSEQFSAPQVVVKDPRAFWFTNLWREAADAADARLTHLTMLRHPAEVVGSRGTHYLSSLGDADLRERQTVLLAAWVNVMLINERATRGRPRVFVPYMSLLEDWRSVMIEVATRLDLSFETDLSVGRHHPVDDFIDGDLHRVRVTWDHMSAPDLLTELAERTWAALTALTEDPNDLSAIKKLDGCREDYDVMHGQAVAFARHATDAEIARAKREVRRNLQRSSVAPQPVARSDPKPDSLPARIARRLARHTPRGVWLRLAPDWVNGHNRAGRER